MHNIRKAVVLAGGLGTRLRDVVSNVPKPMAPVDNRPFLEYLLDYWAAQGIEEFFISVGYLKNSIVDHFGESYQGTKITYIKEDEPLGTGGGLLLAGQHIKEDFLLLNGDTYIEVDLEKLFDRHVKNNSPWTMVLFETLDFDRYLGVKLSDKNIIKELNCSLDKSINLANGGVYMLSPKVIEFFKMEIGKCLSLEQDLLQRYLDNGENIYGHVAKGRFVDIGLPEDYKNAAKVIRSIQ